MPKKRLLIAASILIIFVLVFSLINFLRANYVPPILMYHEILPNPDSAYRLAVSIKAFDRQMAFLKKHHYNVITLEALADLIKEKKRIPPRTIVITLDDGYWNNFTYAFPILKKYNLPATIFIIINEVGRINKFGKRDRLSWDEIKLMQDLRIITFGSHALGPEPLINFKDKAEIKRQIFDSKKILEERLGRKVVAFSYPEGRFNAKIRQWVIDAGYKLAVTTSPGKKFPDDDLFALKRLRISSSSNSPIVFWIETSGFYTFIKERRDD